MAKAYAIADTEAVHDQARYDEYKRQVLPTLEKHGGRFLVRGGPHEVKEGSWHPTRLVLIEFPTLEAAKAWYHDPEYQRLAKLRQQAGKDHLLLVQGL
jgi:uncharacterized protein (DUF1330 family)